MAKASARTWTLNKTIETKEAHTSNELTGAKRVEGYFYTAAGQHR